jgi:hypothetical protein
MASRAATNADRADPGIAIGIAGRAGTEIVLVADRVGIGRLLLQVVMELVNQRRRCRFRRQWNRVRLAPVARLCRP